jgi:hypothetical protein
MNTSVLQTHTSFQRCRSYFYLRGLAATPRDPKVFTLGYYLNNDVECLWHGWQASRDHYAPKANDESYIRGWNEAMDYAAEVNAPRMTEKEALERVGEAVAEEMLLIPRGTPYEDSSDRLAKAALRAADVRFKEGAAPSFPSMPCTDR